MFKYIILILLFVLFTSLKAIGQSLTYTFIDPCTKDVTYFSIPIQSGGGTTIFFLGQQRYFTANDVTSGDFALWINQSPKDQKYPGPSSESLVMDQSPPIEKLLSANTLVALYLVRAIVPSQTGSTS